VSRFQRPYLYLVFASWVLLAGVAADVRAADSPLPAVVEFNRDIRPILSDNCFACHGPDKNQRQAELQLHTEAGAFADRGGYKVLVAGKPADSELYRRITAADAGLRMPPAKAGKQLTRRQTELIRKWIEQGAKWQEHWSRIAPKRPEPPKVDDAAWSGNPIDRFILARLEQEGLKPSAEADRRTLARRLAFDLTGLPPEPEWVEAFEADQSAGAYEKLVDRLLASKHYGERLALSWLDLVRYADTGGYHSDNHRDITLYRDYVINAFNDNKRFDQFTLEQLAGDLLPGAATEHKIASGYNRLLMTTEEGGAQPKEYAAKYAADRVRNVSTVWLAATLGCAECHDHKFDPFTTREFYQFAAFFADIKEKAVGRQDQTLLPTPEQAAKLKQLDDQVAPLRKELDTQTPELDAALVKWEESARSAGAKGLPKEVTAILAVEAVKRTDKQKQDLAKYYRTIAPLLEPARKKLAALQREKDALLKQVSTTLISETVAPRTMRVLPRGNWLDDSGEVVAPGTPAALSRFDGKDKRATRTDLAKWLTASDNPLTARVFVNRLWKLFFGQGIVRTLDDFGSQGTWPTHLELLDWLAVEFRESGWDVKHMVKLMVMSRTYRQSSAVSEALRQRDPYNLLLARQARFRLDAEMVRDNALAVSGLLVRKIGGPSAKPYQPAGYWAMLNFPKREWQNDKGEGLYRRGLYTYWCRTFPHPSLVAFDAPSREECTVERPRSNTPLQALVLLNDPTYVEAARAFAERIVREGAQETEGRIQFAYRRALARKAQPEELKVLTGLYQQHLKQYQADGKAATALLGVGDRPAPKDLDATELAAWTSVARVLLNLHETITRN
jgi:mono/diheme cytochrome c family protein